MEDLPSWVLIPLAFVVINAVTLVLFWADKRKAQRGAWRIKERTLLSWCAVGGWPAGYMAMRTLRHKTSDARFRTRYWACVAAWVMGVAAAVYASVGR